MSKTIEVFNINELNAEAKEVALQELRESSVTNWYKWWDSIYEDAFTWLGFLGLSEVDISFNGFYCQGSGASFEAYFSSRDVNPKGLEDYAPNIYKIIKSKLGFFHDYVTALPKEVAVYASCESTRNFSYQSWRFKEAYIDNEDYRVDDCTYTLENIEYEDDLTEEQKQAKTIKAQEELDKALLIQEQADEWLSKIHDIVSDILYESLENEYEYLMSDEHLTEHAQINELYFFENGNILED